jgi:hypothetical protein
VGSASGASSRVGAHRHSARRDRTTLTGTATTSFKFGDYGMEPPRVPMVLSVVDEIRLELALVATQAT